LTDEDICKKRTCIQHCCPHEEFLESETNNCKPALLYENLLPLTDNGKPDYKYQDDEFFEWFVKWNNETHKKVRHLGN
jgi:hypothetical protein